MRVTGQRIVIVSPRCFCILGFTGNIETQVREHSARSQHSPTELSQRKENLPWLWRWARALECPQLLLHNQFIRGYMMREFWWAGTLNNVLEGRDRKYSCGTVYLGELRNPLRAVNKPCSRFDSERSEMGNLMFIRRPRYLTQNVSS